MILNCKIKLLYFISQQIQFQSSVTRSRAENAGHGLVDKLLRKRVDGEGEVEQVRGSG